MAQTLSHGVAPDEVRCARIDDGPVPIALGVGAGAEARRPLGLAVVGGLVISQFVTLYLTPVFYLYMDSFQQWLEPSPAVAAPAVATAPGAAD